MNKKARQKLISLYFNTMLFIKTVSHADQWVSESKLHVYKPFEWIHGKDLTQKNNLSTNWTSLIITWYVSITDYSTKGLKQLRTTCAIGKILLRCVLLLLSQLFLIDLRWVIRLQAVNKHCLPPHTGPIDSSVTLSLCPCRLIDDLTLS